MRIRIRVVGYVMVPILSMASLAAANLDLRLVEAVERQDKKAVRALLEQQVDVNTPQPDGATALHWAAHWNDLGTVDQLIRAGAHVNAVNELGVAPLSLTCANFNSAMMVERLVRAGADPNAALPSGETVLMTAARIGNVDTVNALLAHGADVNANKHWQGHTALMWAVAEGHADVMKVLIEHGADVHARSSYRGSTPLLLAARAGNVDSARLLLAAGADVNETELLLPPHPSVIDVEARDEKCGGGGCTSYEVPTLPSGNSPLLVASASMVARSGFEYRLVVKPSSHEALATFLLEQGADPTKTDSIGTTPLHAAVQTGKMKLVKALLAHGADPNARFVKAPSPFIGDYTFYRKYVGATPFWLAAAARIPDVDIIRLLSAAGADPNLPVEGGETPLMAAVGMVQNEARLAGESQSLEVVQLLVELDADVNAVDKGGQTAVHGAARLARNTLIQFLVEHGAKVDIEDTQGRTPLDIGTLSRPLQPDTATLLRRLGSM